ncbi:hypothetical protein PoB_003107500 [Plakobranchus ocellatus]|uniref:ShKT domain-containing protein n=1 Tax=Plakobranchus ocellatus TaxID=259542 RepID=A0AAV4A8R4_9GAST|nr:hypothetical protein PoB_003107500 [Plakobranchus ocellatus]
MRFQTAATSGRAGKIMRYGWDGGGVHQSNCRENEYVKQRCGATCHLCPNAHSGTHTGRPQPDRSTRRPPGVTRRTDHCALEHKWCEDHANKCGKRRNVDERCPCTCQREARRLSALSAGTATATPKTTTTSTATPTTTATTSANPFSSSRVPLSSIILFNSSKPSVTSSIDSPSTRIGSAVTSSVTADLTVLPSQPKPTATSVRPALTSDRPSQPPQITSNSQETPTRRESTTSTVSTDTTAPFRSTTLASTENPATPRAAVSTRSCFQCGSPSSPCSVYDLLVGQPTPCAPGLDYCITYVTQMGGGRGVVKKCVDRATCHKDWYELSSDLTECMNFDSRYLRFDLQCSYCCVGDNCNKGVKPDFSTLYDPAN